MTIRKYIGYRLLSISAPIVPAVIVRNGETVTLPRLTFTSADVDAVRRPIRGPR